MNCYTSVALWVKFTAFSFRNGNERRSFQSWGHSALWKALLKRQKIIWWVSGMDIRRALADMLSICADFLRLIFFKDRHISFREIGLSSIRLHSAHVRRQSWSLGMSEGRKVTSSFDKKLVKWFSEITGHAWQMVFWLRLLLKSSQNLLRLFSANWIMRVSCSCSY